MKIILSDESGVENKPRQNTHTDVIVWIEEETVEGIVAIHKYVAAFFTYQYLETIRRQHQETGDFLDGKYFWANGMLLIDDCSPESVEIVVKDLIDQGDFRTVFSSISV